jgi:hypothetical protein
MMDETKKLQKEIKLLPRQTIKWDVVTGLQQTVADMAISLPLVQVHHLLHLPCSLYSPYSPYSPYSSYSPYSLYSPYSSLTPPLLLPYSSLTPPLLLPYSPDSTDSSLTPLTRLTRLTGPARRRHAPNPKPKPKPTPNPNQDLRDDAMRERHWQKLMSICGKTFIMDAKLQLDALLQMELHKFADSVSEVVEQGRAEIKIDIQLQKIQKTWAG